MSFNEDTRAWRTLNHKVDRLMDPLKVDLLKIGSQTSSSNDHLLIHWSENMRYHESKTTRAWERVYLVVSDLKLMLASRHKLEKALDENIKDCSFKHSDVFLDPKDINRLREKHWAIEVDGVYYELDRDKKDRSSFSSRRKVGLLDRRVAARIFVGTTHFEKRALESIGRAVIATQVDYELTRNNCHRFVRVFTSLMLCRNHRTHTIPELPFGVEEHLASRKVKAMRDSMFLYRSKVLHQVGAGVAWTVFQDGGLVELRRTVRTINERHKDIPAKYDDFSSRQEQTSYISELDPKSFSYLGHCKPIRENPYTRLLRFEKVVQIRIEPYGLGNMKYRVSRVSHGIISGPYGGRWDQKGLFERVKPIELMRDSSHVLRDGNGKRLEWPDQDWPRIKAALQDFFLDPPTRKQYDRDRSTPKTELLKSVGPFKDHPYLVDMVSWVPWIAGAGWAVKFLRRKRKVYLAKADAEDMMFEAYNSPWSEAEGDKDEYTEDSEPEAELEEQNESEASEPEVQMLEDRETRIDAFFDNMPLRAILQNLDSE